MIELVNRWTSEPLFVEILKRGLNPPEEPLEVTKAWWSNVPNTLHYAYERDVIDFRGLHLNGERLTDIDFSWLCLDYYSGKKCFYERTELQSSTAQQADFSGSEFDYAQMSPFYARGASFKDCKMARCYLMGIGPRFDPRNPSEPIKGNFSDFRDCDFTNVVATRCYFERCDFRKARFINAKFTDCRFDEADFTEVDFSGASFKSCDFSRTELLDVPELRALVEKGGNLALETILWKPVG